MNWSYLALPLAAALVAPGCCATRCADDSMELHSIERGSQSGIEARGLRLARDAEAWRTLWAEHTSIRVPPPELPAIDFDKHMVAFVGAGPQPSAGYGLRVLAVVREEGGWVLEVEETGPQEGMLQAMVVTQPHEFVRLPKTDAKVTLRFPPTDATGGIR